MNWTGNRKCVWRLCICGECAGTPKVLRIRQDGIEWEPRAWALAYHEAV